MRAFLAPYTLEYELYRLNTAILEETYRTMHPGVELPKTGPEEERALAFVRRLGDDKAQLAQRLAERLAEGPSIPFEVPQYIADAIRWAARGKEESN